jgi:hypothetical protein
VSGSCECDNEPSVSIKFQGISVPAENMLASQGLCSMEFGWLVGRFIGKRTALLKGHNP